MKNKVYECVAGSKGDQAVEAFDKIDAVKQFLNLDSREEAVDALINNVISCRRVL